MLRTCSNIIDIEMKVLYYGTCVKEEFLLQVWVRNPGSYKARILPKVLKNRVSSADAEAVG